MPKKILCIALCGVSFALGAANNAAIVAEVPEILRGAGWKPLPMNKILQQPPGKRTKYYSFTEETKTFYFLLTEQIKMVQGKRTWVYDSAQLKMPPIYKDDTSYKWTSEIFNGGPSAQPTAEDIINELGNSVVKIEEFKTAIRAIPEYIKSLLESPEIRALLMKSDVDLAQSELNNVETPNLSP